MPFLLMQAKAYNLQDFGSFELTTASDISAHQGKKKRILEIGRRSAKDASANYFVIWHGQGRGPRKRIDLL